MKNKVLSATISLSFVFTLSGCFTPPPPPPPKVYKNPNDKEAIKMVLNSVGNNNLSGNALIKQQGGGIVTCAGNEVALFPKTDYSKEYLQYEFENEYYSYGYFSNGKGYKKSWNYLKNPYPKDSKITVCDSQGNFEFQNLIDGTYYVLTVVTWTVPGKYGGSDQGGNMLQEVELKNGTTKKIVLSE